MMSLVIYVIGLVSVLIALLWIYGQMSSRLEKMAAFCSSIDQSLHRVSASIDERYKTLVALRDSVLKMLDDQKHAQYEQRKQFDEHQLRSLKLLQDSLSQNISLMRQQVIQTLQSHTDQLDKKIQTLTHQVDHRLHLIGGQVDKRLNEGFEKTTTIFTDVVKRLALIDKAQAEITKLSGNVVSLQAILSDKQARGAFGEIQLSTLVRNMLPEKHFAFQHTLSNGKRVDCLLFLPQPTGALPIDAKFPLESYRKLMQLNLSHSERKSAEQQFQLSIKKHIQDIAEKYIIPGETAHGAILFLPAEAIFSEIHAHYPTLVEEAHKMKIWLTSPTTMMAVLTTIQAVLKDVATQKQVHIIQEHLSYLSQDFERFQKRMNNLANHISQANADVEQVNKSSQKITRRFEKIKQVELEEVKNRLFEEEET